MSATQTISTISNLTFSQGKVNHSEIKTQEEERSILWMFTLCFLKSRGKFPSASSTSTPCTNGRNCHRYVCGQIFNIIYDFVNEDLSCKGVTGCTFQHSDDDYYHVNGLLMALSKEEQNRFIDNVKNINTLAVNTNNVFDENYFRGQFCYNFSAKTFAPTCFPLFNLHAIFDKWDRNKFPNKKQILVQEELVGEILPKSNFVVKVYSTMANNQDPAIISSKPCISYSELFSKNRYTPMVKPSELLEQIVTGKEVSLIERVEQEIADAEKKCEEMKNEIDNIRREKEQKRKEKQMHEEKMEQAKQEKMLLAKALEKKKRVSEILDELRKELQRAKNEKI